MKFKNDVYASEQCEIIRQLCKILNIDEHKNYIIRCELENDVECVAKIMAMIPSIQKFFSYTDVQCAFDTKRIRYPHISIIKNVLKRDYTISGKSIKYKTGDGSVIHTTKYIFEHKH